MIRRTTTALLLLANAYELDAQDDQAEAVYLRLAQEVSPFRSEAYTALISMYLEQDRGPEAADMMLLAYENTDRENFRQQREDFLPAMPEVSLTAGRYEISAMEQDISLTSPQGYDVYYTVERRRGAAGGRHSLREWQHHSQRGRNHAARSGGQRRSGQRSDQRVLHLLLSHAARA